MRPLARCSLLVVCFLPAAAAQEAVQPIGPAEATQRVDQVVTVQMEVKSARIVNNVCFLNSEADFKDPDNLTLFLGSQAITALKRAGVENPVAHYRDKTVRFKGRVTLFRDRPQIVVDDPKELRIVGRKR
jgi:DNA/RNA endonuclease YhcR with UshA esterase domain